MHMHTAKSTHFSTHSLLHRLTIKSVESASFQTKEMLCIGKHWFSTKVPSTVLIRYLCRTKPESILNRMKNVNNSLLFTDLPCYVYMSIVNTCVVCALIYTLSNLIIFFISFVDRCSVKTFPRAFSCNHFLQKLLS